MSNKEKIFVHAFALLQSTHPDSEAQLLQLLTAGTTKLPQDGSLAFIKAHNSSCSFCFCFWPQSIITLIFRALILPQTRHTIFWWRMIMLKVHVRQKNTLYLVEKVLHFSPLYHCLTLYQIKDLLTPRKVPWILALRLWIGPRGRKNGVIFPPTPRSVQGLIKPTHGFNWAFCIPNSSVRSWNGSTALGVFFLLPLLAWLSAFWNIDTLALWLAGLRIMTTTAETIDLHMCQTTI